jgi:purine-binding chemotaxis protein CheW
MTMPETIAATVTLAGKYLTFSLRRERYGIPILKVREIIRLVATTAVPGLPPHIKGVINLRGKIIPVIDLGLRLGFQESTASETACVVVVQVNGPNRHPIQLGLAVDGVEEVCQFTSGDIEDKPDFGTATDSPCILGMAKGKGTVSTLLDIERVLLPDNIELSRDVAAIG